MDSGISRKPKTLTDSEQIIYSDCITRFSGDRY
jgi:hypothetical protein